MNRPIDLSNIKALQENFGKEAFKEAEILPQSPETTISFQEEVSESNRSAKRR